MCQSLCACVLYVCMYTRLYVSVFMYLYTHIQVCVHLCKYVYGRSMCVCTGECVLSSQA